MKSNPLLLLFLLFLGGLLITGCNDDYIYDGLVGQMNDDSNQPHGNIADPEIRKAVGWYEENQAFSVLTKGESGQHPLFNMILPTWSCAFKQTSAVRPLISVEIPISAHEQMMFTLPENMKAYEETGNTQYIESSTRLIILINATNGYTHGFFMTLVPSLKYIYAKKSDVFRSTYFQRAADFDGYVYFHELDGRFTNGWRYSDGKITHKVISEESNPATRSGHFEYETVCYPRYSRVCTGYYQTGEDGRQEYVQTHCYDQYMGTDCHQEAVWVVDPTPDPGHGGGGTGGGIGGGGEYDPPCTHPKCPECGGCIMPGSPSSMCIPCSCISATLTASGTDITLMSSYTLSVSVTPKSPGMELPQISSYSFEAAPASSSIEEWKPLKGSNASSLTRIARNPRNWKFRARVTTTSGSVSITNEVNVTPNYPTCDEITKSPVVMQTFNALWEKTLQAASPQGRREYGCWVYLNTTTGEYSCGETIEGDLTPYAKNSNASINPGSPKGTPTNDSPDVGDTHYVAFFHTHTPLTYSEELERNPTGPSPDDKKIANKDQYPGILCDYSAPLIESGHDLYDSTELYYFGPNRREVKL